MQMYPGNESEKPYIRTLIEEMKQRYKVSGRTIQVADKGLNCARNIYAAVQEANDGYIFSKSIHGRNLSEKERQWLLLENDANVFTNYTDENGNLLFKLKSCVDDFSYSFKETDPETGEESETTFTVREKRIVSYNPQPSLNSGISNSCPSMLLSTSRATIWRASQLRHTHHVI